MLRNKKLTYISLFSSAGVGCYGFKQANFECIATNELLNRRLKVQKINNKCSEESGYISGDITLQETKQLIFDEISKWIPKGNDKVDVVIATPPCQGMSVANHKKADNEIERNSLVVESIQIINKIKPRFFIFENVAAFMKTGCTAPDGTIKEIGSVVYSELGNDYVITHRILNFKNYGNNSSRTRTIVIGVHKSYAEFIAPIELFPIYREEKVLREIIGDMPSLKWGEICTTDFYHAFRTYPEKMRCWIHDLREGQGAFDNENPLKRPHKIGANGEVIPNQQKNGDKYTRQFWDKVAPCIHTRNDQLASQSTVHPLEDRVFSIRELMELMTIPKEFKWIDMSLEQLNALSNVEKCKLLKKEEMNIRQSIGEAVPTQIFYQIANNIMRFLCQEHLNSQKISKTITEYNLTDNGKLKVFVKENPLNLGYATLARLAELTNNKRENNSAYFTNKFIVNEIMTQLPDTDLDEINILEPSVGIGNFLPPLIRKYEDKKVNIDICDIDAEALELVQLLLEKIELPNNVTIKPICDDFLLHHIDKRYFLVIGNPPFTKMKTNEVGEYLKNNENQITTNLFEFFLEKAVKNSNYVAMITPKLLLNTPEFAKTREFISQFRVDCIQDYGEQGFKGVLVETICIFINTTMAPGNTLIISTTLNKRIIQRQKYIFDDTLPYWVIYRDELFDGMYERLEFDVFDVFRDRQITNSNVKSQKENENDVRVLKSRNVSDDGTEILDIHGYDAYIDNETLDRLNVKKYMNDESVYLTVNMTYKPRVMKNRKGIIFNGSIAILIPKKNIKLTKEQMLFYSTNEYREFYKVARNYQTRSLNVDSTSVYWYGILKGEE